MLSFWRHEYHDLIRLIAFVFVFVLAAHVQGQVKHPVIQFTGVVMGKDSLTVIPGVHVYLPNGGRGTTTNPYGFFSLPVEVGDSIIFSSVGYKRSHFIIPPHDISSSLKVIVSMESDMTFLEEVQVFPFPTEEMFKQAVVTMKVPYSKEQANLQAWVNATYMRDGYDFYATSPASAQRMFQDRQVQQFQNKFGPTSNNLLNPWAWSSFIQSLKKN